MLSERVREALRRHTIVWLEVDPETAWRRVEGSDRPLARDRERFEALHAERRPIYESLADAVVPGEGDAAERALDSLLALRALPPGTRMAWGRSASGEYPAYVGRGLLGSGFWPGDGRRFLVTDTVVGGLYADAVGPVAGSVQIPAGEGSKTHAAAARGLRALAGQGALIRGACEAESRPPEVEVVISK